MAIHKVRPPGGSGARNGLFRAAYSRDFTASRASPLLAKPKRYSTIFPSRQRAALTARPSIGTPLDLPFPLHRPTAIPSRPRPPTRLSRGHSPRRPRRHARSSRAIPFGRETHWAYRSDHRTPRRQRPRRQTPSPLRCLLAGPRESASRAPRSPATSPSQYLAAEPPRRSACLTVHSAMIRMHLAASSGPGRAGVQHRRLDRRRNRRVPLGVGLRSGFDFDPRGGQKPSCAITKDT